MTDIKFPTETRKVATSLIDRSRRNRRAAWREIAPTARGAIGAAGSVAPALPDSDLDELRRQINDCLEARGGEVSARARAAALGRLYLGLNAEGRKRFLKLIAEEFDVDHGAVQAAAAALLAAKDDRARAKAERELRAALQAPRVRLLTQFHELPDRVKFLVHIPAAILRLAREERPAPALQ